MKLLYRGWGRLVSTDAKRIINRKTEIITVLRILLDFITALPRIISFKVNISAISRLWDVRDTNY